LVNNSIKADNDLESSNKKIEYKRKIRKFTDIEESINDNNISSINDTSEIKTESN